MDKFKYISSYSVVSARNTFLRTWVEEEEKLQTPTNPTNTTD